VLEEYHITIKRAVNSLMDIVNSINEFCVMKKYLLLSRTVEKLISINSGLTYRIANGFKYNDYEDYVNFLYFNVGKIIIPRFASTCIRKTNSAIKLYTPFSAYKDVTLRPLRLEEPISNKYYTIYDCEDDISFKPFLSSDGNYSMGFMHALSSSQVITKHKHMFSVNKQYIKHHYTFGEYETIKFIFEILSLHIRAFMMQCDGFFSIFYDLDNIFTSLYLSDVFSCKELLLINDVFIDNTDHFIQDDKKLKKIEEEINYCVTNLRILNDYHG
jgi:hypothetical protein